ncbi:MAG: T9SS type A sorting domain-containing protein [Bacteroidota bacterium]
MRKTLILLTLGLAIFLTACDDLVLFTQKIEGSNPTQLSGSYVLTFEDEEEVHYDTLTFTQVLPYRFIVHSSLAKKEVYNGEIHQRGDDYFLQTMDEETKKWKITAFRFRHGEAMNLFESMHFGQGQGKLVSQIKDDKIKLIRTSKRLKEKQEGQTNSDSTFKVYEVKANVRKTLRIWRSILRKSDPVPYRKLESVEKSLELKDKMETDQAYFKLYPNPASYMINLELPDAREWTASLINIQGREIRQESFDTSSHQINIQNLPSGTYFVRLNDRALQTQKTWKFVKD